MTTRKDYVLGTDPVELARLGFQARLWSDAAIKLWKHAGFGPGKTILDVGSGPGFAARDLAGLLGPEGKVIAIDESQTFLDFINAHERLTHSAEIQTHHADVQTMELAPNSADGAYSRWVLCFVKDPEAVVARVSRALKPGASFAVHDYVNYRALTWGPTRTLNNKVMEAVAASWEQRGGDTMIGLRLPSLMERHGLKVTHLRSISLAARPHDTLWEWPTSFFSIYLPKLVESGHLARADLEAWHAEWAALSRDPSSVFITPTLLEIVGTKTA